MPGGCCVPWLSYVPDLSSLYYRFLSTSQCMPPEQIPESSLEVAVFVRTRVPGSASLPNVPAGSSSLLAPAVPSRRLVEQPHSRQPVRQHLRSQAGCQCPSPSTPLLQERPVWSSAQAVTAPHGACFAQPRYPSALPAGTGCLKHSPCSSACRVRM